MAKKRTPASADRVAERRVIKTQSFIKLVNKRVNAALKKIDLVGNLSNKSSYQYTLEEVDKIGAALEAGVVTCMARFRAGPDKATQFLL